MRINKATGVTFESSDICMACRYVFGMCPIAGRLHGVSDFNNSDLVLVIQQCPFFTTNMYVTAEVDDVRPLLATHHARLAYA